MINPVLRKEIKTSMRSWKIFLAIGLYLLVMYGAVFMFVYFTQLNITKYSFDIQDAFLFYIVIAFLQLGFIILTSPALTASSISGERERQTLDMILLTKMSPLSIVVGKLLSSLGIVILMIITSFPMFAIALSYCGVSIINLLEVFGFFILISWTIGSVGLFFSTVFKRTSISTVVSYIFIFIICLISLIANAIISALPYMYRNATSMTVTFPSSSFPVFSALKDIIFLGVNPFVGFFVIISSQIDNNLLGISVENYLGIVNVIFNILLSLLFLLLSAKNISLSKSKVSKKGK